MQASGRIHGHLATEYTRPTCHRKARLVQRTAASYTPFGQKKTSYKDISGTADSRSSKETVCLSVKQSYPCAKFSAGQSVSDYRYWLEVNGLLDAPAASTLGEHPP